MFDFTLPFIVGLLIVPCGLIVIISSIVDLHKMKLASETWLQTKAKMVKSHLVKYRATSNDCSLFVEYHYSLKGVEYVSKRISFIEPNTKALCEEIQSRFPEGETIDIFYDPENPKNSALIVDLSEFPKAKTHGVTLGIIVIGVGILLIFLNRG